ncbi:hypothetical protein AGMMS49953_07470 [Endomicrobiia bacterium]|nr:hypothetical protein AGMMS49953_07470 [Endomicrobiia bacterium]
MLYRSILSIPLFVKTHPQIENLNNQDHTDGVIAALEEKKKLFLILNRNLLLKPLPMLGLK